MNPISAFFVRNIIVVFFFYGLAFFAMGLALALANRRSSEFRFALAIVPLAAFGMLHGIHEWVEMFQKIAALSTGYAPTLWDEVLRLALLVASFLMLLAFGFILLSPAGSPRRRIWLPVAAMLGLWLLAILAVALLLKPTPATLVAEADVMARYSLGIPAAVLGAWALMAQQRTFREHAMPQFGRDLVWATTALVLYGVIGQLFVRNTPLVPSNVINSTLFLQWFGIPVQLFRALTAAVMAVFMMRALNAFDLESHRRLENANQARLNALNQVVTAQEVERQRIARELHDATGQSLTALGLGLRGLETRLENEDQADSALVGQVRELKSFSTNALGELKDIIADLRPAILDDMGLAAALKWYVQAYEKRRSIQSTFVLQGTPVRLPSEIETVLFRINQEALTNIAKHAGAAHVTVTLAFQPPHVRLIVEDDGRGFSPEQVLQRTNPGAGWGLLGMKERASLIGGQVEIELDARKGHPHHYCGAVRSERMTEQSTIRLLLVDDHEIVRAGLRMLFMAEPDVSIAGEASSGEEALAAVEALRPDVVLMDVAMPGIGGIEATRRIKAAYPEVAVLALTMYEDAEYFFEMLASGASGYVPKRAAPDDLMSAIRVVRQGDVYIYPSMAKLLVKDFLHRAETTTGPVEDTLTQREREVLTCIADGYSNREIADALVISVKTVDRHRENIMHKLNLA